MASATIISSLRRTRSPTMEAFLAPVDLTHLTGISLLETLLAIAYGIQATFSIKKKLPFQRTNSRSLIRKLEVFVVLLEFLRDSRSSLPPSAVLCFTELYMMLYRSKMLLDYCFHSSKLWLLLQNHSISSHFHDLNMEISTLLDVLPLDDLNLTDDVREQVELLQKQARRSRLLIDKHDETLRLKFFSFLDEFENDRIPLPVELQSFFVEKLGFQRPKHFIAEIEYLEEQIVNCEGDVEPTVSVLYGFVSLIRYSRFSLFGFEEDEEVTSGCRKPKKSLITQGIAETFFSSPKDFFCPISLEMMRDPVIISTGQTYDRSSISRWLDEGHTTCPKTGQMLVHDSVVANRALRNLISQWCIVHEIFYDPSDNADSSSLNQTLAPSSSSKASVKANKATTGILIHELAEGSESAKTVAVREIRLIAKTCRQNRVYMAEAGAIPHLKSLLSSPDPVAQENSVTALLNLSIHEKNKTVIMDECCLGPVVQVLRFGHTTEARENAATTLFSLSAVHNFKKMITEEDGAVEALSRLMRDGTARGKKDAVTALFNLSTHNENYGKLVEYGAVAALVDSLEVEGIAEEAAGALALIVRVPVGAEAVGNAETGVSGLMDLMRRGSAKGKENAVAALLELCRTGGSASASAAAERVMKAPALGNSLQKLMFTGTKRARRKAASLARVFQRCEYATSFRYYGNRESSGFGGMLSSSSSSVPVV